MYHWKVWLFRARRDFPHLGTPEYRHLCAKLHRRGNGLARQYLRTMQSDFIREGVDEELSETLVLNILDWKHLHPYERYATTLALDHLEEVARGDEVLYGALNEPPDES